MKNRTRSDYLRRIDCVIALLQQAVTNDAELPNLAGLGQVAQLSPFHFHRVYRALTGETIGRTVARLRLLRALQLLSDPARAVTDAALAVGYETPQAFARAFRQAFGASPSELRVRPARLASELARLSWAPVDEAMPTSLLQVEVVSLEPFSLVATRNTGDFADLAVAYEALFGWAAEHGLIERIAGIYGVPWQDRRDVSAAECEFDCALAFEGEVAAGEGTMSLRLGGGQWARLHHVGSYAGLESLTDALLAHWLPGSSYVLRDEPLFHHYLDDPEQTPEAVLRTDIYLPVMPLP
ncbi:MAG TPA: GyrI-like domain-containing protein [Rhodanobacter sp.]